MKNKILFILIALFIGGPAMAQIPLVSYITTNGPAKYPTHIDSLGYGGFRVVKDTAERNAITLQRRKYGMAIYVQSNDSLYILRDPALGNSNWFAFAPAGAPADLSDYIKRNDTSTMLSNYLLSSFGLKYSDTAAMLSGYAKAGQVLKISDTSRMLSNLLRASDTSGMFSGFARAGQTLSLSDTASMFAGYARAGQYLKLGDTSNMLANLVRASDTAAMLGAYAKAGQTLSLTDTATIFGGFARSGQVLKLSDTTAMLSNLLRISDTTSMLDGYAKAGQYLKISDANGLFSNVIRSTDTATMLSGYAKAGQTVRVSDTAAMLSNHLRISDTTNMLSGYAKTGETLKLSDTTSMLVNYTREGMVVKYSDTAAMFAGYRRSNEVVDTFKNDIKVYSTLGLGKYSQGQTIPAVGKTAMAVLIDALTQTISPAYTQPTVSISGNPSPGTVEIGTALNITLTANFTQNDAGARSGDIFSKNGSPLGGNTDNIASLTTAVSYTAAVSYAQGAVKNNNLGAADPAGQITAGSKTSSAITYTPQAKRYWGYANSATPTDAEIIAALGGNSELSSSKAKTAFDIAISSGSHYVFFAYPASLGPLSSLSVGGFGSLASFTQTTRTFTNGNGYAQSYYIYVNPNDFSTTVSNITTN
jgi:hypothetical protein